MSAEPQAENLTSHEYDGIHEYDNPLPGWWKWLFVASFFFSVGYWAWYHIGIGPSVETKYMTQVSRYWESQLARLGWSEPTDEAIVRLARDEKIMASMAGTFESNCAQCHRANLGGQIGPNLTDDAWKNVKRPSDIFTVIAEGIPGTSMTAWGNRFRDPQIMLLAAYVASKRGSSPSDGLGPEGTTISPWETFLPAGGSDSAQTVSSDRGDDESS